MSSQLLRILDLSTFTGDTWATPGTQTPPPASVQRVVVTGPVRWLLAGERLHGVDGREALLQLARSLGESLATPSAATGSLLAALTSCGGSTRARVTLVPPAGSRSRSRRRARAAHRLSPSPVRE